MNILKYSLLLCVIILNPSFMLSFFNKLYTKYFGDTDINELPPGETEFDYIPLDKPKTIKKVQKKKLQNVETKIFKRSEYEVSKNGN